MAFRFRVKILVVSALFFPASLLPAQDGAFGDAGASGILERTRQEARVQKSAAAESVRRARGSAGCALAPGTSAVRTIREKSFVLERLADEPGAGAARYEIHIPVRFVKHPKLSAPDDYQDKMTALAARCYDEAAPAMRGPDGERLHISLDLTGAKTPGLAPQEIKVFGGYAWVPFSQWTVDYNCPTIVHETMHLLGLPDVYPMTRERYEIDATGKWVRWLTEEQARDLAPNRRKQMPRYCRPLGPVDSLLYDQYESYRAVGLPLSKADYLWVRRNECPRRQRSDPDPGKYLHCTEMLGAPADAEPTAAALGAFNVLGLGREGAAEKKSLFYPNEVHVLLYDASCDEKAGIFGRCIANSDRTVDETCLPYPAECSNGSFDWLTK
ncbi:MAG: hypothetical protein HY403_06230 [Elusimicrobia bacterium]|nr:hypothetical protein [Elusimicrobiota bacterium]